MIWKFRFWRKLTAKKNHSHKIHLHFIVLFLKRKLKNKTFIARNSLIKFLNFLKFLNIYNIFSSSIQRFFNWTHKFYSFQMSLLSSQWDKHLLQNWKGNSDYIRSLKEEEAFEEFSIQMLKEKQTRNSVKIGVRSSIGVGGSMRVSVITNAKDSATLDQEQFVSLKEYNAKSKFLMNKNVSNMKHRLQNKEGNVKFDNMILSITQHALATNPENKFRKELYKSFIVI